MTNPRQATEARLSIQPIEELHDQRRTLVERHAALKADHGSFGKWDHKRKTLLAGVKMKLRAQYAAAGARVSNDQVDDEAHAHPDYTTFVTESTLKAAEWIRVENAIQEINELIQRDNLLGRHVSQELRL
mgnify:FL=1